uniref:Paraneoplastic antigen Ma-like C-terminal domain-containing protein n=1 Tax=Salarias fasciatus TaxID=181472 RepID=A0A672FAW1_SALFA
MDFIQESGIKIPNAVIVSGATQVADQDEQVIDFLKKYGSIKRVVFVDDDASEFYKNLIVEFSYGTAIEGLAEILPYTFTVKNDPPVVYVVKTLSSVYHTRIGGNITKTYLTELKTLAKRSGVEYELVLKDVMSQISEDVGTMSLNPERTPEVHVEASWPHATDDVMNTKEARSPSLSVGDVNPPEIQKVVVEHIVRRETDSSHLQSPVRLRSFSGKTPRPNSEADYDTWRSHIELLLSDPDMAPRQISRRIVESLLPPATGVVKGLRPDAPPLAYLQLLDSAFDTVEDGEELYAQFLNTFQDPGEKSSNYLHRLQIALNQAVKRGGVPSKEVDKHLLKQFCRGCWESSLLTALQLEQKKNDPPSFPELLLLLRTEEDRQQAKTNRMRKHVGATKQRVQIQSQDAGTCVEPKEKPGAVSNAIKDLERQVASLQSQLTSLMTHKKKETGKKIPVGKFKSQTTDEDNTNFKNQTKLK